VQISEEKEIARLIELLSKFILFMLEYCVEK